MSHRPLSADLEFGCSILIAIDSISLAPTVVIAILSSPVLATPPYNFGFGIVGLINAPAMNTYFSLQLADALP